MWNEEILIPNQRNVSKHHQFSSHLNSKPKKAAS
jgi:hypothetical protein